MNKFFENTDTVEEGSRGILTRIKNAFSPPPDPMAVVSGIVYKFRPAAYPSPAKLKACRDLCAEHHKLWRAVNEELTHAKAREEWNRIQAKAGAAIAEGHAAATAGSVSIEEVCAQFDNLADTARAGMLKISKESEILCAPITRDFLNAALDLCKEREDAERTEAAALGIEPSYPAIVSALRRVIRSLQSREKFYNSNYCSSPKQILFWLEDLQKTKN